jgi:class 3 adenylate cyclase/tetratricopeptide (TPR) repeat protein
MRCPRCQHENRPQAKFCEECATLLARSCTACGAQLRPSAQFCPACAHPVAGPGRAELRFTSPESYTPKHLAERILVSRTALEGERKQVTVLFADLKGSMELLADRDPEDARALLDPVLERMMEAVHRYEGTVNQVMGDGIMALFGAPVAHEDHAVRACFAALRMQESVTRYGDELRRSGTAPVQIRVGLNSGEVVVRSIGSDLHMDYTAVGQTMQLAARMEQIARPGSVLLTAATLALAEGYVQVKLVGTVPVPGGETPVATYELVGEAVSRSRFQVTAARGLTRFVGRDRELDHLRQALERARPGHGQVVAVIGEPGVGKSRLFWEFTHSHRLQGWLLLESGSVSYGRATPYLAVIQLLRAYFKIDDRDDQRAIREKVTGKLLTLDEALKPTLPAFLALLDVPVDDPEWLRLEPPQRQQRTLQSLKHLLLRESQAQPVLLVFEDLHWVDSETQLLLDALVDGLPTARILLLVNYRPEYHHTWAGRSFYAQLRMDPLPPDSAEELLTALLGDDAGTRPLKRLLIERTEGNPFFLEESARALAETGVVVGERGAYRMARAVPAIQVPATVQAVLAARIDRLAPDEKRLLQSAAVIGKDVPFALLEAIVEERREEQLGSGLAHLQAAEFLYEAKLFPELEYTFKHALTHEVAYGSLLHQRRRSLHARVLDAIERTSGDRRAEHTESLARHAVHGEVWDKAVDYLREAGARAYSRGAIQESLARYEEALALFPQLPATLENTAKAIDARLDLHAPLWVLGQIPRLIELHQEAERLARGLADPSRLGRVFYRMGNYSWMQARYADAVRYAEEALDIATRIGASEMRSSAIYVLGVTHQAQGRYREAIDCLTSIVEGPGADHARRRSGFT